jgi:hypothetical protein
MKEVTIYRDNLEVKIQEKDLAFWQKSGWSVNKPASPVKKSKEREKPEANEE